MVLEAALDFFFLNRYFKKITYLPYITRNLEVGNHLHGFMNSTLTGTASVQLFRTSLRWPGGAAPTIISVFTGWWGRRSRGGTTSVLSVCLLGRLQLSQTLHNKLLLRSHCEKLGTLPFVQDQDSIRKEECTPKHSMYGLCPQCINDGFVEDTDVSSLYL